jgi:hypothetical protein
LSATFDPQDRPADDDLLLLRGGGGSMTPSAATLEAAEKFFDDFCHGMRALPDGINRFAAEWCSARC